jgi:choline dehydrogenase-like flavoprotein
LDGRKNPTDRRAAWGYLHVVGLGGSTLHFTGEAHRLHPKAMKMATEYGVAADWPLDYEELEPYYAKAEHVIGVAGPAHVSGRHRSTPFPLPAHPMSYASRKLGAACKRLELSWEPNSLATLSAPYDGRPACNYCANCNRGCPRRDKGSVDVTFLHKAVAMGKCEIRSRCQVTRLQADPGDQVSAVEYVDTSGAMQSVPARTVIVACGAVETPRLLLNSTNQHAPDGLANESGQVGKNFMETLYWTASGLHPELLGSHRGLPTDAICWDFNAPDAIPDIIGGCRFSPATAEANLVGPIKYAQRVVTGWGRLHKQRMRESFGRVLSLTSIGENLPNPRSFVDLDPEQRDADGDRPDRAR